MALTCIACKLIFSAPELHHEHYKTDWHRYNLKRRVAELPPVTKEQFEERAEAFKEINKEKEKLSLKCQTCNKHFSSENAMANHLKSQKHFENESVIAKNKFPGSGKALGDKQKIVEGNVEEKNSGMEVDEDLADGDSDWESCDEDEEEEVTKIVVDTNDCLFCDHQSDSTEGNVVHMTDKHSFYIPDVEHLSDLDGLIAFLAGKVLVGHMCLWCDVVGKGFKSAKSVRQHMLDKGHCKMLHEGEALLDYADFYDYPSSEVQEESIDEMLENADYELVLPSGATIGHRSLALYYKQNLKPFSSDTKKKASKVIEHYKSLGYTGTTGPAAVRRAKDIVYMQRIKDKYRLKLGIKNNKMQPHFRPQVMF